MGQDDQDKVKGQNLSRMNSIVSRIESELKQLKNLINEQIHPHCNCNGLTANSINCDGNGGDTSIDDDSYCPMDILKIEDDQVSNTNDQDYQDFNENQDQDNGQNRPSNVDELILGGVDFNCQVPSQDPPYQNPFYNGSQNQGKLIISQVLEDSLDLKPNLELDLFQKSNENLEGNFEVAGKNYKKLSQKVTVQMGVRCDNDPSILNPNRVIHRHVKISKSKIQNSLSEPKTRHISPKPKGPSRKKTQFCSTCSKYFIDFSKLLIHKRIHTGESPFKCKICSKSFNNAGNLSRHELVVHKGVRRYSCSFCSKTFAQSSHLTDHTRLHTGERPYSCSVCDKKFQSSSSLKRHESKKKHGPHTSN